VHYFGDTRTVRLIAGEALFSVAHDTRRPFWVLTDGANIQAVGTEFNVYRQMEVTTVAVIEGRVLVRATPPAADIPGAVNPNHPAPPLTLSPGEEARIEHGGTMTKLATNVSRVTAWKQRKLDFRAATIAEVAAEFNRYNRAQIHIEDGALGRRKMNGVFNADEPQTFLDFLARDKEVRLERHGDGTNVTLRAPPGVDLPRQ